MKSLRALPCPPLHVPTHPNQVLIREKSSQAITLGEKMLFLEDPSEFFQLSEEEFHANGRVCGGGDKVFVPKVQDIFGILGFFLKSNSKIDLRQ